MNKTTKTTTEAQPKEQLPVVQEPEAKPEVTVTKIPQNSGTAAENRTDPEQNNL